MNTFKLVREIDETGISGTGEVAEGVIFDDGTVAMRWLTATASTAVYDSIKDVLEIHGHGGKTQIQYEPNSYPPPWQEIEWETGPQGVALCEILGLDPKVVLGHPFYALVGLTAVHLNFTGVAKVTVEQWEKALALLDPELAPLD